MNALDSLIKNNSDSQFSINKARNTGIVLYRFDGYENKRLKNLQWMTLELKTILHSLLIQAIMLKQMSLSINLLLMMNGVS